MRRRNDVIIGDSATRRGGSNPLTSLLGRLLMCIGCFVVITLFISISWSSETIEEERPFVETVENIVAAPPAFIGDDKTPLVVLLHGHPEGAPYEWNTGVWTGWGEHEGDLYQRAISQRLNWQANGAYVMKTCDVHCHITHDQSLVPEADAVVMELINHYKFFGKETKLPIPWPQPVNGVMPLLGMFHFESYSEYDFMMSDPEIMDRFDFTAFPGPTADLPISLICNWGFPTSKYLEGVPEKIIHTSNTHVKDGPVYVADFRGVVPTGFETFFSELHKLVNIDYYAGAHTNAREEGEYVLADRIGHMGEYMFVIIAESITEDDWVCPEYSQALLSGAIPIYLGASNISEYIPGENAIVDVTGTFMSPRQLADHIHNMGNNKSLYEETHFAWKKNGLSPTFQGHVDNCAHTAECRICKEVLTQMNE